MEGGELEIFGYYKIFVLPMRWYSLFLNCSKSYIKHTILIIFNCTFQPEKAMAPHSSTLPWKIPWTEEPGGLQSMGSRRVGHD